MDERADRSVVVAKIRATEETLAEGCNVSSTIDSFSSADQ